MAALTAALAAATIANTASDFTSQRRAAKGAIAQGNYERGIANLNADYAEQQALDAIMRGNEAAQRVGTQTNVLQGAQRAAYAAQGIDPNVGSATEVTAETGMLGALDALTIRNNAQREAYGFRTQAMIDRTTGENAMTAAQNEAASLRSQSYQTLLTGGLQLATLYANRPKSPKVPKVSQGQINAGKSSIDYSQRTRKGAY